MKEFIGGQKSETKQITEEIQEGLEVSGVGDHRYPETIYNSKNEKDIESAEKSFIKGMHIKKSNSFSGSSHRPNYYFEDYDKTKVGEKVLGLLNEYGAVEGDSSGSLHDEYGISASIGYVGVQQQSDLVEKYKVVFNLEDGPTTPDFTNSGGPIYELGIKLYIVSTIGDKEYEEGYDKAKLEEEREREKLKPKMIELADKIRRLGVNCEISEEYSIGKRRHARDW